MNAKRVTAVSRRIHKKMTAQIWWVAKQEKLQHQLGGWWELENDGTILVCCDERKLRHWVDGFYDRKIMVQDWLATKKGKLWQEPEGLWDATVLAQIWWVTMQNYGTFMVPKRTEKEDIKNHDNNGMVTQGDD